MTESERRLKKYKEKQEQEEKEKEEKKYAFASRDAQRRQKIRDEATKPYTVQGASRRKAYQNRTESMMNDVAAVEPSTQRDLERYKAVEDAKFSIQMNNRGVRNRDDSMANRGVKGYEESYQRWKKVYDANKGPAAVDPKTSRQSEIRAQAQTIQRYTDTGTGGKDAREDDKRWAGVTSELKRLGRQQRNVDTPGAKRTWAEENRPDEVRSRYQDLYDKTFRRDEPEQKAQTVSERYTAANGQLRAAERDAYYWEQAAKDAAWFGDEQRFTRSLPHITESGRRAQGALAQFRAASDEMAGAVREQDEALKQGDLATWYARNLSDDEIRRRLEEEQKPISVTDKDRAENPGMYPDAAFRTMPRQASFDPTMTAGGEAPGNRFYMTEEEKQLTEQSDRYLLQQKVDDREVQITALQRALESHHVNDLENRISWHAGRGELPAMAQAGREAMARDASGDGAAGQGVTFEDLANGTVSPEAMAQGTAAQRMATVTRNLMKCTDQQKDYVYAMYAIDPEGAVKLSQKYYDDAMDEYYARFYRWANAKSGWQGGRRAVAALLGTGAKLLSGLDPFGDSGQDLSRAGEAFIGGASESASRNGLFGIDVLGGDESPISGNVPYIGRGRAGEAVQLGTSILESSAIAVPAMLIGRYDVAASKVAGLLGTTLMGSSAAADDYRESIRNGLTESQAIAHATAAGIAEAAFEYISLDRLIDPGNIKKGLIRWATQGGIEASEEVCTTIANRISDEVIANFSGIRNSIEREALEYQLHGYSAEEAEAKAQTQWLSGLLMDGLGGFMSGLIMGGGSEAIQSATGKIANTMVEDIKDYRSGSLLGLESAGYTNTDTMSALSSYAEANGIDVRGLKDVQAKALERSHEQTETTVPVLEQTQTETEKVNQDQAPTEQAAEAAETAETADTPQFSRRELRKAGKVRSQIVNSITQKFEGQTAAEKAAQYDSLVEQYGSGIEAVATEALYNAARQDMRTVTDVTTLEQRHGTDAAAFTSETARQTMERAYRDTQQIIMRETGDTTRSSMDSLAALNRNLRKTDGATLNLQAEVTGEDGGTKAVSVRSFDNEGKRVVLEDGSKVDVKDLTTDADTKSFLQAMQEAELGEYTNEAFQTFLNTGTEQTLADGIEWITGYRGAFGVGEVRGNITNAIQLAARYGLDTDTAAAAYYQGVKASDALVAQSKQTLANAQEMAKGQKQTVTGRRSNIDVSGIEGVNMTNEERRQFNFANKIFSMIGVELRWVASDEKNGRFVGANGSYLHGVVTLDIHAGRNFLRDVNSGILATTGHELTHFLQEYAPEQYRALKEFLFQQIVQGSANGEARLERLIWEKQRRASSKLSRRAAQDEVVADACQTMLRDSKAIREFAQQDEEAAKGIARWLDKWFGKLKQAFSRSAQLTEEARFVDSFAKDVREAFGKLWDEALREAVETHDRVGNIEKTQQQNSDRDAEYLELAKDPEKNAARLQEMVDERAREAGAMTLPGGKRKPYYHGTAAKFTSFDINKSGDGTFGYGFYFTPVKSFAQGYGPVKSYYIMTDRIATWEDHRITPEQVLQIRSEYGLKTGENDVAKVAKWLENAGDSNVMLSLESAITRNTNVRPAEFLQRFREIFGYDGLRQARETVLFDNRLIKSADPVTYDDAGNVIPLSERFNTENQDIRYSERDELASDNQVHDITNRSGETVGVQDGNGHVQFSQRTWRESGKEKMQEYLDERVRKYEANHNDPEGMHPDDARALMAAVQEQYDALDEIVRQQPGNYKTYEEWADAEVETDIFGNPVFSWLKANGDYGISGDASLICVKRRTLDAVFDYMIQNNMIQDGPEGLKLAQESIVAINDIIRAHGFETACSTCYIDARRYRAAIVAGSFCNVYNKLVRSMLKGKTGIPINAFNFGGNKSVTPLPNSLDTLSDNEINWDGINKAIRDQEAKWESKGWEKFTEDGEEKWRRNGTVKNLPTSGTTEYRIALALKEKPSLRKLALRSDFLSGNGFLELNRTNKDILTLYNVKKGQAGPKATETDIQYLHEALENSFITPERMFKAGGFRLQSFSDYVPRLVFDYVEIIGDLSAKGVPAHMYTKEILCVLQHGLTGTKINMSLIPAMVKKGFAPGLDADGNYLWRDGQTFGSTAYSLSPKLEAHLSKILGYQVKGRLTGAQGFELAKLIQNDPAYGKNNGTIAIGVSEAQIRKMLDDADIRMVIPYHKSGLNHILASMMEIPGFENYESYQNTLKWNGTKWAKVDVDFDFNEAVQKHKGDARAAAQDYLDWCNENGYKPKFSGVASGSARNSYNKAYDFTQHADWQTGTMTGEAESNYYKVLADFTCYDAEGKISRQEAVKLNYPGTDSAFGSMKQLIEMGLESDAMLQAKQDEEVPKIVEDIRREIPKFEAAGRNMKAYAQLKENVEGRQFSERDYDAPSDVDLVMGMDEKDADTPDGKALIREVQAKQKQIEALTEKLAEAKRQLTTTKRALNTKGIGNVAGNVIRDFGISDAGGKNIRQQATAILTDAYQKALDQIDDGAAAAEAWETVYNGAVEAANLLIDQGRYTENNNGRWTNVPYSRYIGENRQMVIDQMVSEAAVDFTRNRYRGPIQETAADRLVARTEKRMQGKLDETKAKNAELKAENERLEQDNTFLKDQADGARFAAGNLYDQVKDLRQELKDNRKLTAQERKTVQKKIDRLNKQIEAKRTEAAAWRDRANRNASLLKSALESKSRDIQTVKDESQRQVDRAVAEKEAVVRKLEDQIEREKKILSGELRAPGLVKLLKAERERAETRVREQKEAQFARYKEGKKAGELRGRIKNLSDEMKRRMTRPTDGAYVPASLYGSMTKLADVLDTVLAPNPGTKAETRYRSMMDAIHSLAAEYDGIKNLDDYTYASEFDQEIRDQISELERVLNKDRSWTDELTGDGKRVGDMSLTELQQTYDILRQINQTMKNAAKLMNNQKLGSLYDAMRNVADQQAGMRSRNASNAFTRGMRNWRLDTMSTMRAVEKMSGWDRNAALYQLMQGIEQGVVDSDIWMMNYNKRMEALKTGKNELEYRKALSKKLDYGVKDTKDGIPVMMTKMQALQILMTAEREAANDKLVHLQKGGAEIRDAVKIQEGKAAKATSYHIDVTPELIQKIRDSLTEWDKQYMQTVHDYFKTESREMNKILYSLKNRVLETEESYVPYIVDSNYLETKLTEQQAMNMWVKTPGSTNALKTKASQPVIIDGMDTVMAKHVRESADYIGLALPIRDFSKVYNGMLSQGEGEIALPVKKTIADNWGDKGAKLLTDAVLDVQGSSRVGSYNTAIAAYLNKLQSGFVKSALLINPSVTIKQAASYIAAESVLSHRALIAGNRPLFTGQDASHSPSLIAQIFAAPSGSTATRIYNEIDEHTSMHYVRRQGMSYTELANEANRQGWLKRNTGMIGAKMEQNAAGHFVRKAGQVLNPVQWIQRMDVATTAALWVACKEQAKMDGMTAGTDEFWQHTTELYEQALRETQPMYDNLHRTNMQKEKTGLMQFLFPFRTVPVQNHGQIAASFDAMLAAKGKSREEQIDAYKHFAKTVWAQTESAVIFSVMTFLAAGLKRKTGKYRDEDDEISPESILKGILNDAGGVWLSNILPMTGSELWSWGSKAINSLKGVPNGYTFDTFSVGVVDMLNDLDTAADRMFKASGKLSRGEISFGEFAKTGDSFLSTAAKIFGIPATTIKTYAEGLWGDVQDIREGRIPAYNDDAVERKNSTNARRFTKAWNAKDEAKMNAVLEEMFGSMVRTSDEAQSARNALSAAAKEAYQTGKMDLEEYVEYLEKTEAFTSKGITTRVSTMLKEDFIAGKRTADETVELLVKYKDYKGNPEQKAWAAVKEWAAKAEHDDEDDYDWNQYDELKAAIAAGEGVQDEIQELKDHGYTQKQINDALKKSIQEAFTAGNYTEGEAIDALVRYGVTYSQNGKAVAYDQDKGWQTVREWAAKAGHEDDEDFSYSLYDNLRSAIAAGNGIEAAMKELTDHGVKEADVNDELNKSVLKLYTEGAITEKTAIGLLTKYHTVTKDKKTRPQTADEAWAALQKASAEAAHADEEDYSYSKYDDIDAALDKNADISKLVKQLTDHGEKQANITNHVKSYLIDRYVAGEASESALKNQLSRYCGITKTDEVAGILKDANCEKDCGYGFGEIKNAYGRGDLSEATAKKMLRKYGELTDSGAEHRIGFWDYCRKNPDTSISAQGWDSYYEKTLPNIGGTLSGRGMKQSSFTEYLEKRAQLEITDLDGDGKMDNKEYIVNLIASLNLSSAEKDMLYYYNNYGARDLWKTPWH